MNNNRINPKGFHSTRAIACAGDELGLLVNLVRNEQIGVKMLLRNVTEILADDASLLVDVVLLITDSRRIEDSDATEQDFKSALIAINRAEGLSTKLVIESAINHAAQKAGFLALPS